jgi:hypothetical protein
MRDPKFASRNSDADIVRRQEIRAKFTPEQVAEYGTVEAPLPYGGLHQRASVRGWRFNVDEGCFQSYELMMPLSVNTPLIQNNYL